MRRYFSRGRLRVWGAAPAGLEYARIAAARGNSVVVYEREEKVGGHVRAYGSLPHRGPFGNTAVWLAGRGARNNAAIKVTSPVSAENIDQVLATERPDHIVVATGARYRRDGVPGHSG